MNTTTKTIEPAAAALIGNLTIVTPKAQAAKAEKETKEDGITLNDFVFQLAKDHSNAELFILLDMEGIKYSEKSVRWYASKARAGVRR